MAIRPGLTSFPFDYATILASVPAQSGDYAIYNRTSWIYVGESRNIRGRVLDHLNGDNSCITRNAPTGFQYELVAGQAQRVARQNQLILALKPVCNQKLG
jgi:excinuclease UvrABC nuclease subunit